MESSKNFTLKIVNDKQIIIYFNFFPIIRVFTHQMRKQPNKSTISQEAVNIKFRRGIIITKCYSIILAFFVLLSGCTIFTPRPPVIEDKVGLKGKEVVGILATAPDYRVLYVRLNESIIGALSRPQYFFATEPIFS